jgi:PKD repeat protein
MHVYTVPSNYTVTLTVTDNDAAQDDQQAPVTVNVPLAPTASFTTSPSPAVGKAPFNVQFTDTSTDSDGTIVAWQWNFGDGNSSTLQNPSHIYTAVGMYTVTLTVTDNSALQDVEQGSVNATAAAPPVASFTTNPSPATGNAPLNVQFTDTSTDSDGTIVSWVWDFGDGGNSTQQNPTHDYTIGGVYTVTLTVTDSDALQDNDQATVTVIAMAPPVASFTTAPAAPVGDAPLFVQFTDTSTDSDGTITAWVWDFGDGSTSSQQVTSHVYSSEGIFTVTLTVTDNDGLQDSEQMTVTVQPASDGGGGVEEKSGCAVSGVTAISWLLLAAAAAALATTQWRRRPVPR